MLSLVLVISVAVTGTWEYAPGRLIVKTSPQAACALVSGQPTGIQPLDQAVAELGPLSIRRVAPLRADGKHSHLRTRWGVEGVLAIRYAAKVDPKEAAERLSRCPGVVWAQPDYHAFLCTTPNDPYLPHQYAMGLMQMPQAWDVETGSSTVVIGISDTGVDWNHPDLAANIYVNQAEDANGNGRFDNFPSSQGGDLDGIDADGNGYIDDVIGWDFVTGENPSPGEDGGPPDPDPMDFEGHGTCTAGIAAAVTNNGLMVAGTAWHCRIMPLKVFYSAAQGSGALLSDILESFYYAADNGAHILSMSWRSNDTPALHEAVQYAHAAGVFLVASAGNDNSDNWQTPSAYPEVLSVAATQQGDLKAEFSNFGTWVGISAPGVAIWTTAFDDTFTTGFSGTSASCPYVAGVAGLVLSRFPGLSNTEVYYRLTGTADPLDLVNPTYRGKLGSGRVNGYRALTESPHPTLRLVEVMVDDASGGNGDSLLGPGERATLLFRVRNFWIPASHVLGRLTSLDPSVQADTATIDLGPLPTDSVVTSAQGVSVVVDPTAQIGYHSAFVLTLWADGHTETLPFSIPMARQLFADLTTQWGLSTSGNTHSVSVADMDGDGDLDIYRAAWSFDHALYRNEGGHLVNVIAQSGLPMTGKGQGSGWADFDNDGDQDLVHGTLQGLALFANDGTGRFTNVSAQVGIGSVAQKNFTPVWGDYDGDGWVDLFVAHQEQPCQLFRNQGGVFVEVGQQAGVAQGPPAYGASFADFDRDGDLDLFVARCGTGYSGARNSLFVNLGGGVFQDQALRLGLEDSLVSTGGVWADYDADGWLDLYVTNVGPGFNGGEPNKLYRNLRGQGFVRVVDSGLEDLRSSVGAAWADFDGDGKLDVFVANRQRNALYRNLGPSFGDASESMGITTNGWVCVWADFDGDGDEDLYLGRGGGDRLLFNLSQVSTVRVRLVGTSNSRDGLLAAVTLHGQSGSVTRLVGEGSGLGQGPAQQVLPLAPVGPQPSLVVSWANGLVQRVAVGGPGDLAVVEERPARDAGIRAVRLPVAEAPAEATVRGQVCLYDQGQTPVGSIPVHMVVWDEFGGEVFHSSIQWDLSAGPWAIFPVLPSPPQGRTFRVSYRVEVAGDTQSWNDEVSQWVTGVTSPEGFELPPLYWDLSQGWRWATADGWFAPLEGRGLLVLEPQGGVPERAVMPPIPFPCGTLGHVRFSARYQLADTLWVKVERRGEVVARMALSGLQAEYADLALPFVLPQEGGQVSAVWEYAGRGGGYFCLDQVHVVAVASSPGDETVPVGLSLAGPWPHPVRGRAAWVIRLEREARVGVQVFDLAGRMILAQDLGILRSGSHRVEIPTAGLASGAYLVRFSAGAEVVSQTTVLVR